MLSRWRHFVPYSLVLPAFVVVFALAIYSTGWLVWLSLNDVDFGEPLEAATPIGLGNYSWLLFDKDSTFRESIKTTVIYVLATMIPELVFGFGIALLLNRKIRGRSLLTTILIIPIVLMPSMVGMVWRLYFSFDGLVNFFLQTLTGVKLNWYGPDLALLAVIIVDIWEWTPFFVLILLAGLQALPHDPFEAARVDGASRWQSFWLITVPLMGPLLLTTIILRLMDVLRLFDVIFVMFSGGPGSATTTLPLYVYRTTLVAERLGRGSAASILLIIMIVVLTYLLIRFRQRVRFDM